MFKRTLLTLISLASLSSFAQGMFVSKYGSIVTIDEKGNVWDGSKIAYGVGFIPKYEVGIVGRNYIVTTKDRVYKTDINGFIYDDVLKGDKIRGGEIELKGDNYFITKRGSVYSFSDFDGTYYLEKDGKFKPENIVKSGKEFFIINEGNDEFSLYLIQKDGRLVKNSQGQYLNQVISKTGSNYFFNRKNNLMVFGADGKAMDKSMVGTFGNIKSLKGNYILNEKSKTYELWTINKFGTVVNQGSLTKYIKMNNLNVMPNYITDKDQKMILVVDMINNKVIVRDLEKILE